jgi:hypothetical protein
MLAQSFKSAADLGITEPQFDALRKTLVLLETGKLRHVPAPDNYQWSGTDFSFKFNMGSWRRDAAGGECGTVCCIGGTAELVGNVDFSDRAGALDDLFYAKDCPINLTAITPAQAATALRSYLTTGDARWDLAVA